MLHSWTRKIVRIAAVACVALGLVGCGCGHSNKDGDGMTSEQEKTGGRMDQIFRKSGGDFDKLEPADKSWLVNSMAGGNEKIARQMFGARGGKAPATGPGSGAPKGGPGGPPPPGGMQPGPGGPRGPGGMVPGPGGPRGPGQ